MENRPGQGHYIFCYKLRRTRAMSEELKSMVNELYEKIDQLKGYL